MVIYLTKVLLIFNFLEIKSTIMIIIKKNYIKKIYFVLIIILIILQITLIAHRNSFEFKYFLKFHLSNIGLEDGIKNKKFLILLR